MFRFVLVVGLVLGVAMDAGAQATFLDNVPIVYVATPRPVQPARVGPTPPVIKSRDIKKP